MIVRVGVDDQAGQKNVGMSIVKLKKMQALASIANHFKVNIDDLFPMSINIPNGDSIVFQSIEDFPSKSMPGKHPDTYYVLYDHKNIPKVSISGKVIRHGLEVIIIFKAKNKYYQNTKENSELVDTYMHTGDEKYLEQLEGEVPF